MAEYPENGKFTVEDYEGLPLYVFLNINGSSSNSAQQLEFMDINACNKPASLACPPETQNMLPDKCTAADHLAPITPEKTTSTKRKYNSNLPGGSSNNWKSKHLMNNLQAIEENVITHEADEQATESLPSKKDHNSDTKMTMQPKARRKKHRPKVIIDNKSSTQKPNIAQPAASEDSIKSSRKNVKEKGLDESTPTKASSKPNDPLIRKLPNRSCKRALVFIDDKPSTQKPNIALPAASGDSIKSDESTPTNANTKPNDPIIRKLSKRSCKRALASIGDKTSNRKPKIAQLATSEESIKSGRKNVKEEGEDESTSTKAKTKPDDPIIRKLPQRSCKRALAFDAEGEQGDDGSDARQGKDAIVLTKQELAITKKFKYFPLHYTRKRTRKLSNRVSEKVECSGAKTILTRKDQEESSMRKQLDGHMDIYDQNVDLVKKLDVHVAGDAAEDIPNQMIDERHMNINSQESHDSNQEQNALVHHSEEGTMIPYKSPSDPAERLRQRAKVHLDVETSRVWKLLLADINSPGIDGVDDENIKRWDEERVVYRGLADLFIARMRLVQGDRHFSPWKGSVVDSVVGAFLTQNVSDNLSSSAFIQLASHFPPKSKINKSSSSENQTTDVPTICPGSQRTPSHPRRTGAIAETNSGLDKHSSSKKKTIKKDTSDDLQDSRNKRNAKKKEEEIEWDILRRREVEACGQKREVEACGQKRVRPEHTIDSVDWEAVRFADVNEISKIIRERGMNQKLAQRIQDCLNRIARDHESVDLEWLRDIAPDKAKEYLLNIYGLGLKSVECVRLLTLHHLAFPVDTNVARVAVRLGWVPIKPLPESLQLHMLELYPMMNSIQKYLWPRLCKLDQKTLYELHYQMITFGKVFCTKSKPNCNACPMRGDCRHYASAYASSKLALPGPEYIGTANESDNGATNQNSDLKSSQMALTLPHAPVQSNESWHPDKVFGLNNDEPIIEEPASPEPKYEHLSEINIEEAILQEADDDLPEIIKLNIEEFTKTLQSYIEDKDGDMSKALVALTPEAASIPIPKLKNVNKLRTQHQVYELPDSHPLLNGLEKRETDDPGHYLLAIWTTPGDTADSIQSFGNRSDSHGSDKHCDDDTCFSCNNMRKEKSQTVRGTLLIPCRTAMRGSFPLNGTYFQVNEVFADHESSVNPIQVPRDIIWNLPRRTVYIGTSVTSIFKGMTTDDIQLCFWRGYVCIRGFDRETRAPRPLMARFHFSTSKSQKAKIKKNDKEPSPKTAAKSSVQKNNKEAVS